MITTEWLFILLGLMFGAFSLLSALDASNAKRYGNAAFWGLMALSLLAGSYVGDEIDFLGWRDIELRLHVRARACGEQLVA